MNKKFLIALLFIGFVVGIYVFTYGPNEPANSGLTSIPTTSLEEKICDKVSAQFGDCKKILLYDTNSSLVFAESSSGIVPVLTNKEFTDFKRFIYPMMDFQEFNEEKVERGPFDWRADVQKGFSVIYGFAEDDAKTIVINSEGNIQPNRFFVRDNLWGWYVIFQEKVELPVQVTVYNANGQIISGGKE